MSNKRPKQLLQMLTAEQDTLRKQLADPETILERSPSFVLQAIANSEKVVG